MQIFLIKIKDSFLNFKNRIELLKTIVLKRLEGNLIYVFFKKKHEWINASLRNYSLFLIWGSFSLAFVRLFQIWASGSWELMNFYYTTVSISFSFTFYLICLRYLKEKGYFKRGEENKKKWRSYQDFVAERHNLTWNFRFSRSLFFLLTLDFIFLNFYRDYHAGETLSNIGMFISSFIFFCYFVNHFYIVYWIKKTPTPSDLMLDPPEIYVKIASLKPIDKILIRKYGTRTRFERFKSSYNNNKKEIWATALGVATVLYWATGTDRSIADFNHETTYGSRVYTTTKGGWYTNSPKTRDRIEQLIDWGVDPTKLCYDDSKCLDDAEVKSVYERIKDEKYPKPYKAEIRELKTHLGAAESYLQATKSDLQATKSDLQVTKSDLEVTKSELESLKKRNLSLEERLAALEKSKESERK